MVMMAKKVAGKRAVGLLAILIIAMPVRPTFGQENQKNLPDEAALRGILEKAGHYCQKLRSFVYHFVCQEKVVETIRGAVKTREEPHIGPGLESSAPGVGGSVFSVSDSTQKNTYLYEYQLIRKKGVNQESRTLIEKNGEKKNEKNARLEAIKFYFQNMAFGPIDLFGESGRLKHNYSIVGKANVDGQSVLIIEAAPKDDSSDYNPSGKIWVRESDCAILKIEWDKRSLFGYKDLEDLAEQRGFVPMITLVSEYGVEKNGIRFPNRVFLEEAYLRKKNRKRSVVSTVTIEYKDYRFFTVDIDVNYK